MFGNFDASILANASKVVPFQVYNHRQFCCLLRAVQQFLPHLFVPFRAVSSWPRSLDRTGLDRPARPLQKQFRGRADDRMVAAIQIRAIKRGTDFSKRGEHSEGRSFERMRKSL